MKILKAVFILSIAITIPAFGGTNLTYKQTIDLITQFQNQKIYNQATTSIMLQQIIDSLVSNYSNQALYAGLEKRLVGSSTTARIHAQTTGTTNAGEALFLNLLYYTAQSIVPTNLTTVSLRSAVGKDGSAIIKAEDSFWKNNLITNSLGAFEYFAPDTAATLAQITCMTWYKSSNRVYESTTATEAAENLWQIYCDVRLMELAKRSVAVKLLVQEGYLNLPSVTYAHIGGTTPDIAIDLSFKLWTSNDLVELVRLLGNDIYRPLVQRQLMKMIPGCQFPN